jgi:hypothetical protein
MQHYSDKYVLCPFYSQEDNAKIRCEGFAKGNSIQVSFENKELLKAHKRRYCYCIAKHRQCPLYPVINKKYEEEDNE